MRRLRQRVRQLREARGFTQEKFAEKVDLGYKYYQSLESGRTANPTVDTLEKIAKALGVDVVELMQPLDGAAIGERPQATYLRSPRKRSRRK